MTEQQPERVRIMRIITRLNVGGPTTHVCLLNAGLNDTRFESVLVAGAIGGSEGDMSYLAERLGIEPIYIPTLKRELSPLHDLRAVFDLIRLMRRYKPHIVHTHMAKAGFVGRWAAWLSGVPIIIHTYHGHVLSGYFGRAMSTVYAILERLSGLPCRVILTVSDRLREELLSFRITSPEKLQVIPLGLELAYLTGQQSPRGQFRERFTISPDAWLVGIIGRLVPIKNHQLFIEAAERVSQEIDNAHFLIVGDGELRAKLEGMVAEKHLRDRVSFTGWQRELAEIYADLDLLVISSTNEGTPVSIIEAMAAGVAVVSTRVGGVADLLEEGRLGLLVPAEDHQALAEAIIRSYRQPDPARTEQASQVAMEKYSAERLVEDIRALYLKCLGEIDFSPAEAG
jgi:glycosyltransferase involved in cell wall biosynthesis